MRPILQSKNCTLRFPTCYSSGQPFCAIYVFIRSSPTQYRSLPRAAARKNVLQLFVKLWAEGDVVDRSLPGYLCILAVSFVRPDPVRAESCDGARMGFCPRFRPSFTSGTAPPPGGRRDFPGVSL